MTTFGCFIGVNVYQDLPSLSFAEADAEEISRVLTAEQSGSVAYRNASILVGATATVRNVSAAVANLNSRAGEGDVVIVYFAGHARTVSGRTALLCSDDREEDLATNPFLRLHLDELVSSIADRGAVPVIIVDACQVTAHSAGMREPALMRSVVERSVVLLYSAREESRESASLGHGLLTLSLLKRLRGGPTFDQDGWVHLKDLLNIPELLSYTEGLASNPRLARVVVQPEGSATSLMSPWLGEPIVEEDLVHSLDGALSWVQRITECVRDASRLEVPDMARTRAEVWRDLLSALCGQFELISAQLVEVFEGSHGRRMGRVIYSPGSAGNTGDQDALLRLAGEGLGPILSDAAKWSRRRAGASTLRASAEHGDLRVVAVPLDGSPPYRHFLLLYASPTDQLIRSELFVRSLRAAAQAVYADPNLSESMAMTVQLDALRLVTGYVPNDLYECRLDLFQRECSDVRPYFQPIVSIERPRVVRGFEALARLGTGETPQRLLWVASLWGRRFRSYLNIHMIAASLRAMSDYLGLVGESPGAYTLSVNCFIDCLLNAEFGIELQAELDRALLPPEQLILEISERASLRATDSAAGEESLESLDQFRQLLRRFTAQYKVHFAIDDFGVERANILRLAGLKLSYVKVDRSILHTTSALSTFRFIHETLTDLTDGQKIVAEGWDDLSPISLEQLRASGCTMVQGFGLGRPRPSVAEAIDEALELSSIKVRGPETPMGFAERGAFRGA